MATQAYFNWVADGRPWELATPIDEYRRALRTAGFSVESVGTLGNEVHLQANRPEDHTPFSMTGWPNPSPYPYVHAIDVSVPGPAETPTPAVAARWIDDALSGRTPWVKYIVWQGKRYDARNGWKPVAASGHFDHVHVSIRTDYTHTSIGAYNPITGGGNAMGELYQPSRWGNYPDGATRAPDQHILDAVYALLFGELTAPIHMPDGEVVTKPWIARQLAAIGQVDPVALADALAHNASFVASVADAITLNLQEIPTRDEIRALLSSIRLTVGES